MPQYVPHDDSSALLAVVAQQPTQKGMPSLTRLDLSHSLSSLDEGDQAKALRAMVSSNGALRELDVSCNQLEEEQLVLLDAGRSSTSEGGFNGLLIVRCERSFDDLQCFRLALLALLCQADALIHLLRLTRLHH